MIKRFLVVRIPYGQLYMITETVAIEVVTATYGWLFVVKPLPGEKYDTSVKEWCEAVNVGEFNTISGKNIVLVRVD